METTWKYFATGMLILLFGGCEPANVPEFQPIDSGPDVLRVDFLQRLDSVLEATYERRLNLEEHAAWQILHGALAFQTEFMVERERGGELIPAVDYLLQGGSMTGWTVEPGDRLDSESERRGLRAVLEAGSKTGQGHADQWLAILAQCGLPADQSIVVGGATFTMSDLVGQVQHDVPRNLQEEFSWTLIGLTSYLPTTAEWVARDGEVWSIERLVRAELEQELAMSACGGTHRLIGLSMTLNRHLDQGGELNGVWAEIDAALLQAIADARKWQNADGSFSTHYFERGGSSPDLAQNLGASGHVLEFLTLSLTREQLDEPWVRRAVAYMCDVFESTQDLPLECGALYHAAHGLMIYRDRVRS